MSKATRTDAGSPLGSGKTALIKVSRDAAPGSGSAHARQVAFERRAAQVPSLSAYGGKGGTA